MLKLGIFSKTFTSSQFSDTLDAVLSHNLKQIHFNFACVGLPSMPDVIPPEIVEEIRRETKARGIEIVGVSGTFNIIHPDKEQRKLGMKRLEVIAKVCKDLPTKLISLCTGTRDPEDMWKAHPDNAKPAAWAEMVISMKEALAIADKYDVHLGIEPETANVVDSAEKARYLLDELNSPHLKIILDPANLFRPDDIPQMTEIITKAVNLLKNDMIMAHAKDFRLDNDEILHVPAGQGLLDYKLYLNLLKNLDISLIIHGLKEHEVKPAVTHILSNAQA